MTTTTAAAVITITSQICHEDEILVKVVTPVSRLSAHKRLLECPPWLDGLEKGPLSLQKILPLSNSPSSYRTYSTVHGDRE